MRTMSKLDFGIKPKTRSPPIHAAVDSCEIL